MAVLMDLLKRIFGGTSGGAAGRWHAYAIRCSRCGEPIEGRVDLNNDLSIEYEAGREGYHVRKVLTGSGRCFQRIEVTFRFSADRRLIERRAVGGEFIE
jgi:hypothetical protein